LKMSVPIDTPTLPLFILCKRATCPNGEVARLRLSTVF
jgi:hypothetical protein